jgi:hypothetical protein
MREQEIDVRRRERGVGFQGGTKIPLDPDVQLAVADLEPAAATGAERFRLIDLLEAEQAAKEIAGLLLAAGRARRFERGRCR